MIMLMSFMMFVSVSVSSAIAEVETGHNYKLIGKNGERSAYQISKHVWKAYSKKPFTVASTKEGIFEVKHVVTAHMTWLAIHFIKHTNREPSPFDIAVMWNAGFDYYKQRGFNPKRIKNSQVRNYAERVSNITNKQNNPKLLLP